MILTGPYTEEEQRAATYASFVHSSGRHLSAEQATELEAGLAARSEAGPDASRDEQSDLESRLKLLGYYKYIESAESSRHWMHHYLWFIANQPDKLLITYFSRLPHKIDTSQFQKLRQKWVDVVAEHPEQSKVLGHAADFIGQRDYQLAEWMYKKAEVLSPHHSCWPSKLCNLYFQQARAASGSKQAQFARLAFGEADRALAAFVPGDGMGVKIELLMRMCDLALDVGDLTLARTFAERAVEMLDGGRIWLDRPYCRLGLIAIKSGDMEKARDYFLKSAEFGFYSGHAPFAGHGSSR